MLSSCKVVRPQMSHSISSAPKSLLVISHAFRTGPKSRLPSGPRSSRRPFSWRTRRSNGSYNHPSTYKPSLYYGPTGSPSYSKILYRNYFWKRGHSLNQYTQGPEWRLTSSWGRPSGGARSSDKASKNRSAHEESTKDGWYNAWQERHRETLKQFDEFKKLVDEDPYKTLFGDNLPERWYSFRNKPSGNRETDYKPIDPREPSAGKKAKPTEAKSSEKSPSPDGEGLSAILASRSAGSESERFVIDPITMRKIPKANVGESKPARAGSSTVAGPVNITVKTFSASSRGLDTGNTPWDTKFAVDEAQNQNQDWLSQEGFGKSLKDEKKPPIKDHANPTRMESALDRYQKKPRAIAVEERKQSTELTYDPKEIQTDDVDLLTASDIRASAGCAARALRETTERKEHRRHLLEKDFNERPEDLEKQLKVEIDSQKAQSEQTLMRELEQIAEEQRKRDAVRTSHEEEVKAQKAAMETHETGRSQFQKPGPGTSVQQLQQGEGDMASNVHEFHGRDRWYKRKAPHASLETEQKLQQATKDKNLVREIRAIYEDNYGTIDTKHRQSPVKATTDVSEYPSDACPGTVYEQSWTANVLNDHPDVDAKGRILASEKSDSQDRFEKQNHEALSLIGKLFNEMRENQALLHKYREELQRILTRDQTQNLLQSLKAHEQRIMHTLKAAQGLFKSATIAPAMPTIVSGTDVPSAASQSSGADAAKPQENTSEEDLPTPPTLYKILAYDPSSDRVVTTRTSNLVGPIAGKALTFTDALFGLKNPAKFLPHFTALKNGPYEVAAGAPNLLIFKKIRQLEQSAEEQAPEDSQWQANPIDAPLPVPERQDPPEAASSGVKGNDKIRRQEEVFSGSSRRAWHDQHERGSHTKSQLKSKQRRARQRRQTVKRMLLVGGLTAAGCYAVGVALEFLRL